MNMHTQTLSFLAVALLIGGCAPQSNPVVVRPRVMASFYPVAFLAQEIGGSSVDVHSAIPNGVEPHDYEPTPQTQVALISADLVFVTGLSVDASVERILDASPAQGRVVRLAESLQLLPNPFGDDHGHEDEEANDGHDEEDEAQDDNTAVHYDPHIWLDPVVMITMAEKVRDSMVTVDPVNASAYHERADRLIERLHSLDLAFMNGLAQCERRTIITSHAAFQYLVRRYDLEMVSVAGISPNDEPTPRALGDLSRVVKAKGVSHIFTESIASSALADTLAREAGAQTLVLDPIEGLSQRHVEAGQGYLEVMEENLTALRFALACRSL